MRRSARRRLAWGRPRRRRFSRFSLIANIMNAGAVVAYTIVRLVTHHGHWLAVIALSLLALLGFLLGIQEELQFRRREG